jgi:hypothetical protein
MTKDQDQRQFFKDMAATAEQTVEEVRGIEENYFVALQKTLMAFPWAADLNAKLQNYAEQNFADALAFSHELSQAKDIQDVTRINAQFVQKRIKLAGEQVKDFAEACTDSASRAIRAAYNIPSQSR